MEVKIKNFNCINNVNLELSPGFTIIQGPSNSGKSSILKAIENCIFNQSGTSNIKQGQANYSVGIKHNNHTVCLNKGKNSKYKIDDQIYEKFGVNQLPEVADALNIRETVLGGEKVRLNFSKQMTYPFLLDKSPGQLYKFIVDSSESESLSNVLKDISKDIKEVDKNIIQNEAQMDLLIKQQAQLNDQLKSSDKILEISNEIISLDSTNTYISQLISTRDKCNQVINSISDLQIKFNSININIDMSQLDRLKDQYLQYDKLRCLYNNTLDSKNNLEHHLDQLSLNIDIEELDNIKTSYINLVSLVNSYKKCLNDIDNIGNNLFIISQQIVDEKAKLDKFKVCPLCGNELNEGEC